MRKTILFALTLLCLAVASCDNVYTTNVMLINQSDSIITVYKGDKEVVTSMPAPTKGADAVYEALKSGELPREVLDRAVTNVLIMKQKIGILR